MNYQTTTTNAYMGAIGYEGCNSRSWDWSSKKLKDLLMQEFKQNGIKASIRKHRGGWTTSLTITIKADPKDCLEEYDGYPWQINHYHIDYEDRFTEPFKQKLILANQIISSFNYDNSNGMVDYFDVGFYYNIDVKC